MGLLTFLLLCLLVYSSSGNLSAKIGVNYGLMGNNLRSPSESVKLFKSLKAKQVKIYDANPQILNALKATDLDVSIMVPNEIMSNISTNQTLADQWVHTNVVPFYPQTRIRYLLVGNEILSPYNKKFNWYDLVPAIRRINYSVKKFGLYKIKVGTPSAFDVLDSPSPPSNGTFRSDISGRIVKPLLQFLNRTKSFFFLDVYTYFPWASDHTNIKLDYALLMEKNLTYKDPVSGLIYTNLLDQMIDSVYFAMNRLGYPNIPIFIAETGWPNGGDVDQIGANIYNAATYNRNVVKKLTANPPIGTPARPGVFLPAFIFALYNENQKPGPGTERHFGLLYPNGSNVYEIDLSGKTPESAYKALPPATNNEPYKGKIWCVAARGANKTELAAAMSYACGQGNRICDPIRPGGKCYKPNSLVGHSSYAFSSYWAEFKKLGGTCFFNGLAVQTVKDPSYGSCKFPSIRASPMHYELGKNGLSRRIHGY